MNIKQLKTFVQVVDQGSFAAAAEVLHITQSTVSSRVKDLEFYFGVDLFDRSAHRAQLTAKGRELYGMSQQVVFMVDSLRLKIGNAEALTGTLRLGVVGFAASTWLPAVIAELRIRHPRLVVQVEVALSRVLTERLRESFLDAAIVAGESVDEALHGEVVGKDRFMWMASPSLCIPRQVLGPEQLAKWPVLTFPAESFHFPILKKWFRDAGLQFSPATTCNNMDVLARLAIQGLGVALLPCEYFDREIAAGQLELIHAVPVIPPVEFMLIHRVDRNNSLVVAVSEAVRAVRTQ